MNPDIREEVKGPPGREGHFGRGPRQGEKMPGEIAGALVVNAVRKLLGAARKETDIRSYRSCLECGQKKGVFFAVTCCQRREGAAGKPKVIEASSQSGQPIGPPW